MPGRVPMDGRAGTALDGVYRDGGEEEGERREGRVSVSELLQHRVYTCTQLCRDTVVLYVIHVYVWASLCRLDSQWLVT